MSIQSILDRKGTKVLTIRHGASARRAADTMQRDGVAALVVTNGDQIAGIVSERDIVRALSQEGERALSMTVGDVMSHTVVTVQPSDTVKLAMRLMTDRRVRHLVVTENGKPAGVVSMGDVVRHRLEDLETESNVLRDAWIAAH